MELIDRLFERWRKDPARVVLVDHGGPARHEFTAACLLELVASQETRFAALEDPPQARPALDTEGRRKLVLGLCAPNSAELAAALIAALQRGIAVAPLSTGLPAEEVVLRARLFGLDAVWSGDHIQDEQRFAGGRNDLFEGAALLLSTSGTTGEPRAVVIGQDGLSRHTLGLADEVLGLGDTDRVLCALPLAHSFGCRMALLAPLAAGAVVHIVPRFSARTTLRLIEHERLTWAPVVPTMLSAWCALEAVPAGLRWLLSAGAPLPGGLRLRAERQLGCEVREGYGLTEASFCTLDRIADPATPGSVGRTNPGVSLRLSPEGEVEVCGPNLMLGYLGEAPLPPGTWLATGDIGRLENDRLFVVDRKKDIVLCGGFTVYPAEVERVLSHVPGVKSGAVFGVADEHLGERVAAAIVWDEASEAMPDWDGHGPDPRVQQLEAEAARHLARHSVPSRWFFVVDLPTGPTGKVKKRSLRGSLMGLDQGAAVRDGDDG